MNGTELAFIQNLGGMEFILLGVVALVLFGGKRLPEFGKGMGSMMREFKKATEGHYDDEKKEEPKGEQTIKMVGTEDAPKLVEKEKDTTETKAGA